MNRPFYLFHNNVICEITHKKIKLTTKDCDKL